MASQTELVQRHAAEIHTLQRKHRSQLKQTQDPDVRRELKAQHTEKMAQVKQRQEREMDTCRDTLSDGTATGGDKTQKNNKNKNKNNKNKNKNKNKNNKNNNANNNNNNNNNQNNDAQRKLREKRRQKKARRAARKEQAREDARHDQTGKEAARAWEEERLQGMLASAGLRRHPVRGDGHCMYRALGRQLYQQQHRVVAGIKLKDSDKEEEEEGRDQGYDDGSTRTNMRDHPGSYSDAEERQLVQRVRETTARYMRNHPEEFRPFLETEDYTGYCDQVAGSSAWGGQIEMRALSMALGIPVYVYQAELDRPLCIDPTPTETGDDGRYHDDAGTASCLRLVYLRHAYGLGEHYDSVTETR